MTTTKSSKAAAPHAVEDAAKDTLRVQVGRDHLVKSIEATIMRVTPGDASDLLTSCRYDRQRGVRGWWVASLAESMRRGEFYEGTQLKMAQVKGSDEWFMLDGQHRLHAIVLSKVTCTFTVTICTVDSEEEAWKLYYTTDTGLARSLADAYPEIAELLGNVRITGAQQAAGAAALIAAHFQGRGGRLWSYQSRSKEFRLNMVRQWAVPMRAYFDTIGVQGRDIEVGGAAMRSACVAIGTIGMHWQPERAREFWRDIVLNGAMERRDPRRVLVQMLLTQRGRSVQPNALARGIAACWSYHFDNKEIGNQIGPTGYDTTRPIEIAGTPYRRYDSGKSNENRTLGLVPTEEEFAQGVVLPVRTIKDALAREPMVMGHPVNTEEGDEADGE